MIFHLKSNSERAGVTTVLSGKTYFKIFVSRDRRHFMLKWSIHQEDVIIIINIYTPKERAQKYIKQNLTELQGERDDSLVIAADFNIPLSVIE